MRRAIVTIALIFAVLISFKMVWMAGFDTGSAVMQCVDYVAVTGSDDNNSCRDARVEMKKPLTQLLRRR
jgi:hypothetical protein